MASVYSIKNPDNTSAKKMFESDNGSFEDEIYIRGLKEQNKNLPIFKGAFMKCKNNGMTTKTDNRKLTSYYYYGTFFTFANLGNAFLIIKLLQFLEPFNSLSTKISNGIPIGFFVFSVAFSYYKIHSLKNKLDMKYTPLWLKSSGSSLN